MAEENTQAKVDMSAAALEIATSVGFGSDQDKFAQFEKELVKKFYEVVGLSDIPEEFLTLSKFIEAYSGVLVKSVQSDIAIMNLTKRLAMFRLSENIQSTSDNVAQAPEENKGGVLPTFVPPTK